MYSKYSFHRRLTLRLLCIALCACMALNGCSSTSLPDDTLSSEQEEMDDSVSSLPRIPPILTPTMNWTTALIANPLLPSPCPAAPRSRTGVV